MPKLIADWFKTYAKSHNTPPPEFVFVGAVVTTACIMGADASIEVRATYKEPVNLYALCIGFPGCGSIQDDCNLQVYLSHSIPCWWITTQSAVCKSTF